MEIKIPIAIDDKVLEETIDKRVAELKKEGDFVLVTRCKDCKWFYPENPERQPACLKPRIMFLPVNPDDFCSYAEPKEIEGE